MMADTMEWSKFTAYDLVFVVYEYSLGNINNFVKYIIRNRKDKLYFVRSKCDNFEKKN